MPRLASVFRRFVASRRAVAAIEFAMVVPIFLLMLLASFDAGNGIAVYMKVRSATYSLAAITNQYPTIQTADMTTITSATAKVLAPYSSAPAVVVISQIRANSATQAVVSWSYSPTAGNALTQGAAFSNLPANFALNTCGGAYPCYMILRAGAVQLFAVIRLFHDRPDHALGQPVRHSAHHRLHPIQRRARCVHAVGSLVVGLLNANIRRRQGRRRDRRRA